MGRYAELQNLYTKEIFQKVPENSARSRRWLDFPTCETIKSWISLSYESVLLQLYDLSPAIHCYQTSDAWRVVFGENQICGSSVIQFGMWRGADIQMKDHWEELFGKLVEFFNANEDPITSGPL